MKKFEELLLAEMKLLDEAFSSDDEDEEGEEEAEETGREAAHEEKSQNSVYLQSIKPSDGETKKDVASANHQQHILNTVRNQVNNQEKSAKQGVISRVAHAITKHL